MLTTNFRLLARYNRWMNARLYDGAAQLTDTQLTEDRGAYFNHQTHHRGQVTTLLNQFGIDVGGTDLLMTIREWQENSSYDRE